MFNQAISALNENDNTTRIEFHITLSLKRKLKKKKKKDIIELLQKQTNTNVFRLFIRKHNCQMC